jgi:serine/threonine protein kinase
LEASKRLGKYEIQHILGEGGMGIVYKAYDTLLQRHVAIKTIRQSLLEGKSGHELLERFRREARAEGSLTHPNIIMIYDYQESEDGIPFFVMEFIEGKDLKAYLSRGVHFNLEKSLDIIEQVLKALAYSHRQGIVHRDIKPANIILQEDDSVKIADFGIAKMEESEYTQTGMVMGTPQYISPEQKLGQKVDGRSDLYSCGAVLYELLTGTKAHSVNKDTTLLAGLKELPVNKLDTKDPLTQRLFKQVIAKALTKDPDDRFSSAEDFFDAIQTARPKPLAKEKTKRRWLALGSLSILLLVGGIGAYYGSLKYAKPPQTMAPRWQSQSADQSESAATGPASSPTEPFTGSITAPSATPLTAEQQLKIENHLRAARVHMLVKRLILPPGSNAYHSYTLALAIDPDNSNAKKGLELLQNEVIAAIRQRRQEGDLQGARELLKISLQLFPESQALQHLQ